MDRRTFIRGLLCATALPSIAAAQPAGWTPWSAPAIAPYQLGDREALKSFRDLVEPYGFYQDLQTLVLTTEGDYQQLNPPVVFHHPSKSGLWITRMLFARGAYVSNMYVTRETLTSAGWAGKKLGMTVWTLKRRVGSQMLIIQYIKWDVCSNRSISIMWQQGDCIPDHTICTTPECQQIRRAQYQS